jgi:hypothetical protein
MVVLGGPVPNKRLQRTTGPAATIDRIPETI